MEIILISQSKIIDEEILRQISETRRWTRHYQVKSSLVHNPKTPVHISLNFLRHLRHVELKQIMSDRNLPGVINKAARQILMEKR
jgi:pentose-5-phosphate-3-epimerase